MLKLFSRKKKPKVRQVHVVPSILEDEELPIYITLKPSPLSITEVFARPNQYGVLQNQGANQWRLRMHSSKLNIPHGQYDFVTMCDGAIRVMPSIMLDMAAHAYLSGGVPEVACAGTIKFDREDGEILSWNNSSDAYLWNDVSLAKQARLPLHLFLDINQPSSSPHPR